MKTKLSVNINKLATLRNSRGKNNPDIVSYAKHIIDCGAQGITVHPRPDGRHILYEDVVQLKKMLTNHENIEFNIEGYPSKDFLELIKKIKPHQCTLVPDSSEVLTSNAGWKFKEHEFLLKETVRMLQEISVRVSLFLDPFSMTEEWSALEQIAPERIELYTEAYAKSRALDNKKQDDVLATYKKAAVRAQKAGIEVNAGHDLDQKNIRDFLTAVDVKEVSIGHALICEALIEGFDKTIKKYLSEMK